MTTAPAAPFLSAILEFFQQTVAYTFVDGTELDQSYSLTGATSALQGRDYGYNALGASARPMGTRKTVYHVVHRYGVGEDWSTVKDALTLAFGHGRPVWLQKVRPDGKVLIAEAVLDSFPDRISGDARFKADFTVTFEQRGDWMAKALSHPRYDTGLKYDSGLKYDTQGLQFPCVGAVTSFDLTNNGTVAEREAFLQFDGPMTGPITLVNYSADVRGIPFGVGAPGAPMYLEVFVNLAAGDFLSIACRTNTVLSTVAGIVPWAQVVKAPGQTFYWELPPGLSHCQLSKNDVAAAGSFYILARDRYR